MNNKQKLHQIKLTHWAARFQEQAASGLTVKTWCAKTNVTIHSYNYWKHKLKLEYIDSLLPAEHDIVALTPEFFQTSSLSQTSGTVVTDGYQIYHKLADERETLRITGYWIHARRPFADFIKSVGLKTAKGIVAQEAYDMITDILHTDNEFDDLSNTGRRKQRQTKLQKKVDAYFKWIKQKYSLVETARANVVNTYQYLELLP